MRISKVLIWAVVIFSAWFMITNPVGAAHAFQALLGALKTLGNSLATFLTSL